MNTNQILIYVPNHNFILILKIPLIIVYATRHYIAGICFVHR